eukprot:CAMPEP_0117754794 /NCGR_PEP_ID=MMETSP0947-20121206/13047_1 /TAXON_ID=44440 /ORGANISM="Chattonella subsalsa, Strain CCMP2191" /LENGTH=388 /DNA_ID=CAMNT_0005573963 /DNA_START=114 /DNA_END=1280 /DNA_ORIENTATION=-
MGGEMVYILQQRLNAQKVPVEKASKVLQDVVRTMYSSGFLEELFKPQKIYSNQNTKQIFDKLAHSSIMKLNKSSMEKLYDLMTMGFKYQVLLCSQPEQLLQVTMSHLQTLKQLVAGSDAMALVEAAQLQVEQTFGRLSSGEWRMIREQLLQFFKGRKIKVSLFLKSQIQKVDGTIVLNHSGPVPIGGEVPGVIRFFRNDRMVSTQTFDSEAGRVSEDPCNDIFDPNSDLGCNMYMDSGSSQQQVQAVVCNDAAEAAAKALSHYSNLADAKPRLRRDYKSGHKGSQDMKVSATEEVNLLANLMGSSAKDVEGSQLQSFKINLFPDDMAQSKDDDESVIVINIDGASDRKDAKAMMKELKLDESDDEDADAKGAKDEHEDLLDLMDSSAK